MRSIGAVLTGAVLLAACVGPARSSTDYLADIVNTAEAVVSTLETARLAADAVEQHRSTGPYASLQLSEAETDATSVATAFASVQPPSPALDSARAELIAALQAATRVLGDLRLAAFRGESDLLSQAAEDIPAVRDRLRAIAREAKVHQ
jgi:hypothetical protein